MSELQRLAMQPQASFGDELSRVGPRVIDWASIATCSSRVTAPRVTAEAFWSGALPLSSYIREAAQAVAGAPVIPAYVTRSVDDWLLSPPVPVRLGLLGHVAPANPATTMSVAAGAGGRDFAVDAEATYAVPDLRLLHATAHVASHSRRVEATLRSQAAQKSVFAFWSFGRPPVAHHLVPAVAEYAVTGGTFRTRWAERLRIAAAARDEVQRRATRRPFVKVGVGVQAQKEPIPMVLLFGGVAAEVTQRTSVAFHTDLLHRTCTTLTSALTSRLTAVFRLRCNLISKADTFLDAALEYRWSPAEFEASGWRGGAAPQLLGTEAVREARSLLRTIDKRIQDRGGSLPVTTRTVLQEANDATSSALDANQHTIAAVGNALTALTGSSGGGAAAPSDVPTEVAFRASLVGNRVAVGFTADNAMQTAAYALRRVPEKAMVWSKIAQRVARDLESVAAVTGPARVTCGVLSDVNVWPRSAAVAKERGGAAQSPPPWAAPRFVLSISV